MYKRVLYYLGDLNRDLSLENYPNAGQLSEQMRQMRLRKASSPPFWGLGFRGLVRGSFKGILRGSYYYKGSIGSRV